MNWVRPVGRWLVAAGLSLAMFGAGCAGSKSTPGFGSGSKLEIEAPADVAPLERAMFSRLNRDRAKEGLPPLKYDPKLAAVGRAHSADMRASKFFAHESPNTGSLDDRLDRAGLLVRTARENLGEGPDVEGTQDALLASPGHYANIMADDITHVGIGIVRGGVAVADNLLVTQVFADPLKAVAPEEARRALLQRIQAARKAGGARPLAVIDKLDDLARAHVDELPDDLDASAAERIGERVTRSLRGSGMRGVTVVTTLFLSPELYEPRGVLLEPSVKGVGVSTAPARDPRGRPAIKALVLVGL